MSDWTKKNLRDVEDRAPGFGAGELQSARFAHGELEAKDTGVSLMGVKPGKRQAFAHKHEKAEEVYVVIAGSGRMKLDEDVIEIGPLDAIRVAPGVTRAFEAGDEGLELLAVGPRREGDGEIVRNGFWGDH
ncbi:MAG: cupin domain-containing protein [Solirubrobacteraceae bacterium]